MKKILHEIYEIYPLIKNEIEQRLDDFKKLYNDGDDYTVFKELVFCIFTPQSKAESCWSAVQRLDEKGLILGNDAAAISSEINIVRFRNNKARYLIEARKKLSIGDSLCIKEIISGFNDNMAMRDWLVKNIKGIGMKEAGHFMRNIGFGENIAILDRHILKNLSRLKVIPRVPSSIGKPVYLDIENKMLRFCEQTGIPASHMDFLLWYKEAGMIFK
jgi:N-glycosylase/DNA lyase